MKSDDVPQEGNRMHPGQRKAVYAVTEDGTIGIVPSRGWEAEELVTGEAVAYFEQLAQQALVRARAGKGSALEVLMYARRMDLPTLAQATGLWRWRVKRHLRQALSGLAPQLQQRYADALGLPVTLLQTFDPAATFDAAAIAAIGVKGNGA
jgi:hypothetical protein